MIYIRIELWPKGDFVNKKVLNEAIIINTGKGTVTNGIYKTFLSRRGGFKRSEKDLIRGNVKNVLREIDVNDFPRKRKNIWNLLKRCLVEE